MNSSIKNLFIFTLGAAVGSLVTYKCVKDRCEQRAQEEVSWRLKDKNEPIIREDDGDSDEEEDAREKAEKARLKPDLVDYSAKIREYGYSGDSDEEDAEEEEENEEEEATTNDGEEEDDVGGPYVISPYDFGQYENEYDMIELTYYADGILADDMDVMVEDVEATVGFDSLNTFGQYEENSVFVRNDRLKTDFEILRDPRKYMDVIKAKPHQEV